MADDFSTVFAEQRYKDGLECAKMATSYDQHGEYGLAITYYSEAVESLTQACQMTPMFSPIMPQVQAYSVRAEELRQMMRSGGARETKPVSQTSARDKHNIHQLEYLLEVALLDDEQQRYKEAETMYSSAIELALRAERQMANESDRQKVGRLTMQAMERLEAVKLLTQQQKQDLYNLPSPPKTQPGASGKKKPAYSTVPRPLISFRDADPDKPLGFTAYSSGPSPAPSHPSPPTGRSSPSPHPRPAIRGNLTDIELKVLKQNSKINGIVYVPWKDIDVAELRRVTPLPVDFKDPDGLLQLAGKQRAKLKGWMRPGELSEDPKMVYLMTSFTIKQTLIGDCSFVASLAVCADYERKFKERLITRVIHPQNSSGNPIINPNGKYLVCLNLNGCKRRVIIDDRLPVGDYNELLCSYSSNDNEFWISLIEKAYMKVMGGYDFPGSSSNIDLHALTGWIPERIDLKKSGEDTYRMVEATMKKGSALVTVATGQLSPAEAERAGLVPTHAYAVLNVVQIKGNMLMQLKNPWSHKRWRGNFSEHDKHNWTPELRRALNFDQMQALQVDNGVFWIDWKSLCRFYDVLYINWKPSMFPYQRTLHDFWKPSDVEKDLYNISNNPQYSLQVHCGSSQATVWLLLSRHITTKSDFANNEKFITLHIAGSNGKRLYLPPDEYKHAGIKINTPHYLAKLDKLPPGTHTFTVVVSQLESLSTIYYTMRVYSTCKFSFSPVPKIYQHTKELRGDWKAGRDKPKFKLTLTSSLSQVLVQLRGPRKFFVWAELKSDSSSTSFKQDSGPSRPGYNIVEASNVPSGPYIVSCRTFNDQDEGPFFVSVTSDCVFNFEHSR